MDNQKLETAYFEVRRRTLKRLGGLGLLSASPAWLTACGSSVGPPVAPPGYRAVSVDAGAVTGTIRSLQGMNDPPVPAYLGKANVPPNPGVSPVPGNPVFNPNGLDLSSVYKQMHVDLVRTHDLDADGSGNVDGLGINRIFPDWNADPTDPASYNFAATDTLIAGIVAAGEQVFFSLGRSDLSMVGLPLDGTLPPDFDTYAIVAKQIVLHYNKGWANGYQYGIQYWEIWNEPDTPFWSGSVAQYYSFYQKVATAIKSVDATLKVGGPATASNTSTQGLQGDFLQFLSSNALPLDFYSFHWYAAHVDPLDFSQLARSNRALLNQYGFSSTELHLTEWGYEIFLPTPPAPELMAAFLTTAMTYMQDAPLDRACLYQRTGLPVLQDNGSLTKAGSAFSALGSLIGMSRLTTSGQDENGFSVLAGRSADRSEIRVLIGNYQIPASDMGPIPGGNTVVMPGPVTITYPDRRTISYSDNAGYQLVLNNLPWQSGKYTVTRYRIDASSQLSVVDSQSGSGQLIIVSAALAPPSVELIVITAG